MMPGEEVETMAERFVCDLAADGRVVCRRGRRLRGDVRQITVKRGDREAVKVAQEAAKDFFNRKNQGSTVEVTVED